MASAEEPWFDENQRESKGVGRIVVTTVAFRVLLNRRRRCRLGSCRRSRRRLGLSKRNRDLPMCCGIVPPSKVASGVFRRCPTEVRRSRYRGEARESGAVGGRAGGDVLTVSANARRDEER
jgi:hypothetical protein